MRATRTFIVVLAIVEITVALTTSLYFEQAPNGNNENITIESTGSHRLVNVLSRLGEP